MHTIISKNNQKVKEAYALKQKKERQEKGLFLMEGRKNLDMALAYGQVDTIFTMIDLPDIDPEIEIFHVNKEVIDKLAFSECPEGVVFVARTLKPKMKKKNLHKIIYLDGVSDPGNLGTMIRTATAFNFDAIVLAKGSVDIYNEKVLAATKGSVFLIDAYYDDLANYKKTHKIIVSTLDKPSLPLNELPKLENFVLVLGNESHGVSPTSLALADIKVNIPISNKVDSLNVAVAASIFMHHLQ
jgi:TrmH family RNA methyltransferase